MSAIDCSPLPVRKAWPAGLWALMAVAMLPAITRAAVVGRPALPEDLLQSRPALVDRGLGAGVPLAWPGSQARRVGPAAWVSPAGSVNAAQQGVFGAPFYWPVIPMHTVLLPDGRVLAYGSTPEGEQGASLNYAVWDPRLGTGPESMTLLPNSTGTDIFCAGQTLLPVTGDVLVVGGDRTVAGMRNFANSDVNVFRRGTNTLERQAAAMAWQRWYATVVSSAAGEQVVLGGRVDRLWEGNDVMAPTVDTFASTPEVWRSDTGWRSLTGATANWVWGSDDMSWYYPRAWAMPDGRIVSVAHAGGVFALWPSGVGKLRTLPVVLPAGDPSYPSVMFSPGKVLSVRLNRQAVVLDMSGTTPAVQATTSIDQDRQYSNATLLADGQVWVNGGSSTGNDLAGAAYLSSTWNPTTGLWTAQAAATKARLYHATSMLLPDGSVLTAGGGGPGPVAQLNAEIFYPPYLYRADGSGQSATRPVVAKAPTVVRPSQTFNVTMGSTAAVSRVTLVRFGAVTHAFNADQRFQALTFSQSGSVLQVKAPANKNLAPPGFYLLFAFDQAGVPAIGKVLSLL